MSWPLNLGKWNLLPNRWKPIHINFRAGCVNVP